MSPAGTFPVTGEAARDFTLPSTSGSDVTSSSLRGGKVLLAFVPLAFTSTCTSELCDMSEDHGDFSGSRNRRENTGLLEQIRAVA